MGNIYTCYIIFIVHLTSFRGTQVSEFTTNNYRIFMKTILWYIVFTFDNEYMIIIALNRFRNATV